MTPPSFPPMRWRIKGMITNLRSLAEKLAYTLGITLYLRDGWIHQTGPGERIDPSPLARPTAEHGRFEIAATAPDRGDIP
jgi:hypothetical protein